MEKNPPANAGNIRDMGSIPGLGRSPGEGHGNPLQYSCLENPMDRGVWRAAVHRVAKSDMNEAAEHAHTLCGPEKPLRWHKPFLLGPWKYCTFKIPAPKGVIFPYFICCLPSPQESVIRKSFQLVLGPGLETGFQKV